MTPIVSVLTTSYNQIGTISKAIDSVLMQKTNFDYELIIVDDGSIDGSVEKLIELRNNFPDKIKLILNEHKGILNTYKVGFSNCTAKYIALCDGDDYWTDPLKLQKQVEFMDINLAYAACFAAVTDKHGKKIDVPKRIDYNMLLRSGYSMTQTILFRRTWLGTYLEINKKNFFDWAYPFFLLMTLYSDIYRFDDIMGVYNKGDETFTCTKKRSRRLRYILGMARIRFYFLRKYSSENGIISYTIYRFVRDMISLILGRWKSKES